MPLPDFFEDVINELFIVLGLCTALVPTIWDIKKDAPIRRNPSRKVFTRIGKFYLVIMVITLILAIVKYDIDNNSQKELLIGNATLIQAHKTDSVAKQFSDLKNKKHLDSLGFVQQIAIHRAKDSITYSLRITEASIKIDASTNRDDLKRKMDSIDKETPDLLILSSYEPLYKSILDSLGGDVVLAILNLGNGRAYDIDFTWREIKKAKPSHYHEYGNKYQISITNNVFRYRNIELSQMPAFLANRLEYDDHLKEVLIDTMYFVLDLKYSSKTKEKYHTTQLFFWARSKGVFSMYLPFENDELGVFLKENGYTNLWL